MCRDLYILYHVCTRLKFLFQAPFVENLKPWECFLRQKSHQLLNHLPSRKVKEKGRIGGMKEKYHFERQNPQGNWAVLLKWIYRPLVITLFANTVYCLLCSFIPCPWEEIWYCACFLNDFKTSIYYPLLTVYLLLPGMPSLSTTLSWHFFFLFTKTLKYPRMLTETSYLAWHSQPWKSEDSLYFPVIPIVKNVNLP